MQKKTGKGRGNDPLLFAWYALTGTESASTVVAAAAAASTTASIVIAASAAEKKQNEDDPAVITISASTVAIGHIRYFRSST